MKKYLLTVLIICPLLSFCQDSAKFNFHLLSSKAHTFPCKWDTIRGTLFYHMKDIVNGGNFIDSGYVVYKCEAFALINNNISFIPGEYYYTVNSSTDGGETWTLENEAILKDTKRFYTISGKRIPNKQVYALIRLK